MADVKFSSNLFLEVNELNRFKKSLCEDGYKKLIKYLTKSFGIAQNSTNTLLKVSQKSGTDNVVVVNAGIAFDSDLNAIVLGEDTEITIENTGVKKWLAISFASSNDEEGTVNISASGVLTGTNTKFTDVLRGQGNFPTKVTLTSSAGNTGEYEVVDITSDTSATLSGSFTAESGIKYQVMGAFTPGFQASDDNKLLYEYDSCSIRVIESEDTPTLNDNEYLLASVYYDDTTGNMNVTDERLDYLFNYESSSTATTESVSTNTLACLKKASLVQGTNLELQFEFGYKVSRYEMITTSTSNTFNIIKGSSNYLGTTQIPDNIFSGWLLLNRKNMKSVVIDSNTNSSLDIPEFDSSIIETDDNDFIIIPNYSEIEIEIALSGTNYDDDNAKIYHKYSLQNTENRVYIPLQYSDTTITMKYRMLSTSKSTGFNNFAITQFVNISGTDETLANSSFTINISEPTVSVRNYS
jgi:hypothetical protein